MTNKRIFWISAVTVTALVLSLNAFAQPGPGGGRGPDFGGPGGQMRGGFFPGVMGGGSIVDRLLQNEEAVKMLELIVEQKEALQKIMEEARTQRPQGTPGTPPNLEEMRQRMDEMHAKYNQVLNPEQQVKVREMAFQLIGGLESRRFLDDRMLEVLDLTAEQKDQILKITTDRNAEARKAMSGFNFREATQEDREKFRTEMDERAKKYGDKIKAVLTSEQKAKAEKLTVGAADLREKLGFGQPGQDRRPGFEQRGPGREQGGRQRDGYTPGANSWRPGQAIPNAPNAEPGNRPQRGFPRSENIPRQEIDQ